jgi:hypothetical protein
MAEALLFLLGGQVRVFSILADDSHHDGAKHVFDETL